VGSLFMLAAPVVMVLTRAPGVSLLFVAVAIGSTLPGTLVHLLTLPVEFDSSFNKAHPCWNPASTCTTGTCPTPSAS
jgi:hypothetical protein